MDNTYSCTETAVVLLDLYLGKRLCLNCNSYGTTMATSSVDLGAFNFCYGKLSLKWRRNIRSLQAALAIETCRIRH